MTSSLVDRLRQFSDEKTETFIRGFFRAACFRREKATVGRCPYTASDGVLRHLLPVIKFIRD
jgi:hypothetical protein